MTEKVGKILNQIKKKLEGIKNELKKSNASRDKRYKEWMTMKKKWRKRRNERERKALFNCRVLWWW